MQPILVTGGAGFIGSRTCKALAAHGFHPIAFDNLSHRALVQWGPLARGDILQPVDLDQTFAQYQPKSIIHFAALAYVGESVTQPLAYYENNVSGLIKRARRNGAARGRHHRIFKFTRYLWSSGRAQTEITRSLSTRRL